ncbi:uncharacterized protein LOC123002131 isoform X3 [Ursus arctos]|uniref:uncharacterized protein LOC123002131 isoform X3 n=1 Tax=Ursus arctos TaxID=9644 RepID=UPI00254843C6|nr:uncharacterized protein LOC123002131 isoform X3 [Ursus arctos]
MLPTAQRGSSKPVSMESPENLRSSKYADKVSFLDLNNGRSDLDNWNWVFKTLPPGMPSMTARRQPNVSLMNKVSELKPGSEGFRGSHLVLKMIGSPSQGGRNPLDPAPRRTCVRRQSPRSILSSQTIKQPKALARPPEKLKLAWKLCLQKKENARARLEHRAKTQTAKQQLSLPERVGFVLFLARADVASVGCGEQYPSVLVSGDTGCCGNPEGQHVVRLGGEGVLPGGADAYGAES